MTEADFEAGIVAAPDDVTRYAVYQDWLQQRGAVRGDLMALQVTRPVGLSPRELQEREEKLLRHPDLRVLPQQQVTWRWGFVYALAVRAPIDARPTWFTEVVGDALGHPSCRFLRELGLEGGQADSLLPSLTAKALPVLKSLELWSNEIDLADVPELPNLERLSVRCQLLTAAPLKLRGLRSLDLPFDATTNAGAQRVIHSVSASLTSLELHSFEPLTFETLSTVLAEPPPQLETLTLSADEMGLDAVEALAESRVTQSLTKLDLSASGLSEAGARRLLELTRHWPRLATLRLGDDSAG